MTSDVPTAPIRVLIADDLVLIRHAIRSLLAMETGIEVVAEAGNGVDAVHEAQAHRPDVVLMDVEMPGGNGLVALEQIAALLPEVRVVMLTVFDDVAHIARALMAGAYGFVLKDDPQQFAPAVRAAHAGDRIFSPPVLHRIAQEYPHAAVVVAEDAQAILGRLTERERDVLAGVGQDLTNAEVGHVLNISAGTVKLHVQRVLTKLGCRSRVGAAVIAHRAGLRWPPS